jgi:hypothetical protein
MAYSVKGRRVRNPYGRLGGPAHQNKVQNVALDIENRGFQAQTEFKIDTPNGVKLYRFADVVAMDIFTGLLVEIHQIGVSTKKGLPVSRERKAIRDIEIATGQKVIYHSY